MFENNYKIRVSARAIVFDKDKILLNRLAMARIIIFPAVALRNEKTPD
jgi:hypothetical protein